MDAELREDLREDDASEDLFAQLSVHLKQLSDATPMGPPPPSPPPAPPSDDGVEEVEVAPAAPHYVEAINEDVVFLQHVQNLRFRHTYAQLLGSWIGPDGRVPVRVLPIATRQVLPLAAGEAIRVRPDALGFVPRMLYYTDAHPVVAAWIATHATPELLAAQVVPLEFANTTAVVAIGVPSGTLAARFYIDCWPRQETPGLLQLLEVNPAEYERDAQPLSGATAGLFEDRICKGALPPPELYIFRVSPLQSTSVHVSPAQPGWT